VLPPGLPFSALSAIMLDEIETDSMYGQKTEEASLRIVSKGVMEYSTGAWGSN